MNDDTRRLSLPPFPPEYRASGVLLHVASLPSPYGIGDVGPAALAWIDRLDDAGISDGALEFPPVTDDGGGVHQARQRSVLKTSDPLWNEVLESVPIGFPLVQNRHPAQPRLGPFEHEELE